MTDLTPEERTLLVEALLVAEQRFATLGYESQRAAARNLRSRLAADPRLVVSYRTVPPEMEQTGLFAITLRCKFTGAIEKWYRGGNQPWTENVAEICVLNSRDVAELLCARIRSRSGASAEYINVENAP